jgi:hypothetical protein
LKPWFCEADMMLLLVRDGVSTGSTTWTVSC